jgi:hypothetical protein
MAVKKTPKVKAKHSDIVRGWKTEDKAIDFELSFDDEGDPTVSVFDADEDTPCELSRDLPQLNEVISILTTIKDNAVRIMSGNLLPEDTVSESEEEEEESEEEEENEDE